MFDADPPHLRVTWVRWYSGFRGSGVLETDQIVAVDGEPIVRPASQEDLQRATPIAIGQFQEYQAWQAKGLTDADEGRKVKLTVRRRAAGEGWESHDIEGTLGLAYGWRDDDNRPILGLDGPVSAASDGFQSPWDYWLEGWVRRGIRVLDGGWRTNGFQSRVLLDEVLAEQDRVAFLSKTYKGRFAEAVTEDYERLTTSLEGRAYKLSAGDLAFRKLDDERAEEVAAASKEAKARFLAAHEDELLDEIPTIDLLGNERAGLVGKCVVLPPIPPRNWIPDGLHTYLVAMVGSTPCFVDTESPAAQRMRVAARRYEQLVTPNLDPTYGIVGRILADPALVVVNGTGTIGLELEPVAATVGDDRLFVDLTAETDGRSLFAGEAELARPKVPPPANDATPREVLEAAFAMLKAGDREQWLSLFANWMAVAGDGGRPIWHPFWRPRLDERWVDARRRIEESVCDVRVYWCGDPHTIITGKEWDGLRPVDQVVVEVDHIGQFGDEFRAFSKIGLNRIWTLQRVDGGPWRITSEQGI